MEKVNILVIDNDKNATETVIQRLVFEGWNPRLATTGQQALDAFNADEPDVVVIDVTLPDFDGFQVIRRLRLKSFVPIIVVSAKIDSEAHLQALEFGADDFLNKPIKPSILIGHIKAWLKRYIDTKENVAIDSGIVKVGDISIDNDQHIVQINGKKISHLTPTEFNLLVTFASMPYKVITRRELLKRVWGWENVYATRTVDTHVKSLRQKIDAKYIETIHGIGYKLLPEGTSPEELK